MAIGVFSVRKEEFLRYGIMNESYQHRSIEGAQI